MEVDGLHPPAGVIERSGDLPCDESLRVGWNLGVKACPKELSKERVKLSWTVPAGAAHEQLASIDRGRKAAFGGEAGQLCDVEIRRRARGEQALPQARRHWRIDLLG